MLSAQKPKFIYDPQFLFSITEPFRSFEYKTKVLAYLNPSNAFKFPPYLKKKNHQTFVEEENLVVKHKIRRRVNTLFETQEGFERKIWNEPREVRRLVGTVGTVSDEGPVDISDDRLGLHHTSDGHLRVVSRRRVRREIASERSPERSAVAVAPEANRRLLNGGLDGATLSVVRHAIVVVVHGSSNLRRNRGRGHGVLDLGLLHGHSLGHGLADLLTHGLRVHGSLLNHLLVHVVNHGLHTHGRLLSHLVAHLLAHGLAHGLHVHRRVHGGLNLLHRTRLHLHLRNHLVVQGLLSLDLHALVAVDRGVHLSLSLDALHVLLHVLPSVLLHAFATLQLQRLRANHLAMSGVERITSGHDGKGALRSVGGGSSLDGQAS